MFRSIQSGATCETTFGTFGNANFTFKRLLLVSAPARGKIRLREGGYYISSAPANDKGTDEFKLRVCGTENNNDGCAELQYSVTVN